MYVVRSTYKSYSENVSFVHCPLRVCYGCEWYGLAGGEREGEWGGR